MSRRRRDDDAALSLDSFLDIVTNVVGVLILIAVVTVISAGDIAISSGASSLRTPPSAQRALFECAGGKLYFVDEAAIAARVRATVGGESGDWRDVDALVATLDEQVVGDDTYRVHAQRLPAALAWTYSRNDGAEGDVEADLALPTSAFQQRLDALAPGTFVYFVVREDSFELFREARAITHARGIASGWHPLSTDEPLRLSSGGQLGRRVQ
jgi:hypothetical protein